MARNRRNGCGYGWNDNTTNNFVPWSGCNNGCTRGACYGTTRTTCGTCNACGQAFNFNNACPFLNGCGYPMTFDEMLNLLSGLRYGRLAVCVNGTAYVMPVCFSVRNCDEAPIFTLRVRTDGCLMNRMNGDTRVTLQFDRAVNGGVCTVQVYGTAHVTGSTGCVAIIEVRTDSMMGECFRNNNCGCRCNGNTDTIGNGCGCNNWGTWNDGCNACDNGCGCNQRDNCNDDTDAIDDGKGCGCN